MSQQLICGAVRGKNLIQFYYAAGADPGPRLVEPHMVAYNEAGNLALSGWFLGGNSESQTGQGWKEYLLESIRDVAVLEQRFLYTRPGYNPTGGKKFRSIQCAV